MGKSSQITINQTEKANKVEKTETKTADPISFQSWNIKLIALNLPLTILALFTFVALTPVTSNALPLPNQKIKSDTKLGIGSARMTAVLPATFTENYDFEGIVKLSNCSGSLVQLEGAKDTDRGLILTNGHCLESGLANQGEFTYGVQIRRNFSLLKGNGSAAGRVTADMIVYSSMTKTDLTLYRLTQTYAEIKSALGVRPLILSSSHPKETTPIEVISGYWYRGYSCNIEKFITHLKEDQWIWDDAIRYSRPGCEVIGGTSGSPIISAGTRTVIGVNNTGNNDGESCTMDNPCEIDEKGNKQAFKGYSYGEQTYWVYSCLNKNGELDLSVSGCMLHH